MNHMVQMKRKGKELRERVGGGGRGGVSEEVGGEGVAKEGVCMSVFLVMKVFVKMNL